MSDDSDDEVEYELETFHLGEFKFSITTVAYLPITKLLKNQSNSVEISGQKLWCGSLCLVNYFFTNSTYLCRTSVIELGAGTGVVSMLASKLGGAVVIATDHDQLSIDHMITDKELNNTPIFVEKLDWFHPELSRIASIIEAAQTEQVLIIAGDVLYKFALLLPFFQTVATLFGKYSTAQLLLCHVPRAGVEHGEVVKSAESFGFQVNEHRDVNMDRQLAIYCPEEDLVKARLYTIKKPCSNII
jgi:hypothetical protein